MLVEICSVVGGAVGACMALGAEEMQKVAKGMETARMAYSLQIAAWKEQNRAAGNPVGPSPPPPSCGDAFNPIAMGVTLERGKLSLGLQANGSSVDELRTEPSSAIAHVLCDFSATGPAELTVSRGEFVTVLVGAGIEVPDGWCHCQVSREDQWVDDEGLVPWFHLLAVMDPEHQTMARAINAQMRAVSPPPLSRLKPGSPRQPSSPAGAKPASSCSSPGGAYSPGGAERGSWHEVSVSRSGGGSGALGLDVNEYNCICRISPGSAAALSGKLQVALIAEAAVRRSLGCARVQAVYAQLRL